MLRQKIQSSTKKGELQQREKEIHGNRFYADHQVSLPTQKSHRLCGFKQNHSKFVSSFSINKELSLIYVSTYEKKNPNGRHMKQGFYVLMKYKTIYV